MKPSPRSGSTDTDPITVGLVACRHLRVPQSLSRRAPTSFVPRRRQMEVLLAQASAKVHPVGLAESAELGRLLDSGIGGERPDHVRATGTGVFAQDVVAARTVRVGCSSAGTRRTRVGLRAAARLAGPGCWPVQRVGVIPRSVGARTRRRGASGTTCPASGTPAGRRPGPCRRRRLGRAGSPACGVC